LKDPPKIIKYDGLPRLSRDELLRIALWSLAEIFVQAGYGAAVVVLWALEYQV